MKIKWYGTASIEYKTEEGCILFDPFIPLFGSKHQVDISEYDGYSDILITHGHFDHIVNIPQIVDRNPKTHIYCTKTPYKTLVKKGVPRKNLKLIRYGDMLKINGFKITVFHGKHAVLPKASTKVIWNVLKAGNLKNLPFIITENLICTEKEETVMFLVESEGKRILHMGSLNMWNNIEYPTGCDLLMLPYNGWKNNYPPAVRIIKALKPKKVMLHHYDNTFPPITSDISLEPIIRRFGKKIVPCGYREFEINFRKEDCKNCR